MKKILYLLLSGCLLLACVGCGNNASDSPKDSDAVSNQSTSNTELTHEEPVDNAMPETLKQDNCTKKTISSGGDLIANDICVATATMYAYSTTLDSGDYGVLVIDVINKSDRPINIGVGSYSVVVNHQNIDGWPYQETVWQNAQKTLEVLIVSPAYLSPEIQPEDAETIGLQLTVSYADGAQEHICDTDVNINLM